jgi:hypothetical protein
MSDDTPAKARRARRSCIFRTEFCRKEVDPRVQEEWKSRTGVGAPFGDLRSMWVREHCVRVAPADNLCPYPASDCAMSFLAAVQTSLTARTNPRGYFRRVAKTMALDRLDNKPLARDQAEGPRNAGDLGLRYVEGSGVSGTKTRPVAVGDLLRSLDLGSRQGSADDGEAGAK